MKTHHKDHVSRKRHHITKLKIPFYIASIVLLFFFFTITSTFALYERQFTNRIYPGVKVDNIPVSTKRVSDVVSLFEAKNQSFGHVIFTFHYEDRIATISAQELRLGYNAKLMGEQAYSIGRSNNFFADTYNKIRAWIGEINLPPSYSLDVEKLEQALLPITNEITVKPEDAIFELEDGRVVNFRPSVEGKGFNMLALQERIFQHMPALLRSNKDQFIIELPITTIRPKVSLEDTNTLGIKEHIAQGRSTFTGSVPNRMHNIALSVFHLDGVIVPKGEVFSFNNTVGEISQATGYKEAYVIKQGRTILDDGGGVCQVSTTLFRAVLNGGLPIVQRHAHSYRVSYYEQDSAPGLDATVYAPTYDFQFKNDTEGSILIEATLDLVNATLVFDFYGTSDGRQSELSNSVITNIKPAPEDRYEDDPMLPKGVVKQTEHRAQGATVTFSRIVKRNEEVLISETFTSVYRPWQAVYLRGTKEN